MSKYKGGLIDTRKEKKDFSHLEVAFAPEPKYLSKSKAEKVIGVYEVRNQKSTSSCGAHAGELAHSIDTDEMHEPAFIYRQRANYPAPGMWHFDIGDIIVKKGVNLNKDIKKTELSYNTYTPTPEDKQEALKYHQDAYIVLEDNKFTIDDIAYIVNDLKRPFILFVYWKAGEWDSEHPKPRGDVTLENASGRHFVTVLPNSAYIYNKKKYFIIQDSSWFGGHKFRHISEDWVNNRVYTGLYFTELIKEPEPEIVKVQFTKNLQYGDSDIEVRNLQKVLQQLGFFPANIEPTGYFGGITRQAVKDFQQKYEKSILWIIGLKTPTGYFGPSTRKVLNELISNL